LDNCSAPTAESCEAASSWYRQVPISRLGVGNAAHNDQEHARIPSKGERIELLRTRAGVRLRGTVYYSDDLQILVKWDNGRSQSLRPGVDHYRIIK
jgi:Domain of unknown function (DUF4314)